MGGVAFQPLKSRQNRPENPKQAEIRLASLLKILSIAWRGEPKLLGDGGGGLIPLVVDAGSVRYG
jgi:hypothetical protein